MTRIPYAELDTATVCSFAAPYLGETVQGAEEIGDGNINVVFRVYGASSSVIVKQGLRYLRAAGESWPLTRYRARIERDAIWEHSKLAPKVLPRVISYEESLSALVMEDLTGHISWRDALIAGSETPGVAERAGRYCADVLLGTSDIILSSTQRKGLRDRFGYSELCKVTEDLVFTAPYADSVSNRFDAEAAELAASLRRDHDLRGAVAQLRSAFKTRGDALLHGDLHTGSLMVEPQRAASGRVIDLEFAFFGPIGFDPGILLANLALSRIAHEVMGNHAYSRQVDSYARDYWTAFTEEARRLWPATEPWYDRFLAAVLADASRFAGMEMIRRIVGLAHAKDIDSLPQPQRLRAQQWAVSGGRALILGNDCKSFPELWTRVMYEENF